MTLMQERRWLPNPPEGTPICLGFDGSDNNDWSAIRAETVEGFNFTPRYGPDRRPSIWNPAEWNERIPRQEVYAAIDELFTVYKVERFYCDPHDWYSDIGDWALKYGEDHVFEWPTNMPNRMYDEIRRFEVDLAEGKITHDGCPITAIHIANARKKARPGQKYTLDKPSDHQKIDVAMSTILAHTAAADARSEGWDGTEADNRIFVFR